MYGRLSTRPHGLYTLESKQTDCGQSPVVDLVLPPSHSSLPPPMPLEVAVPETPTNPVVVLFYYIIFPSFLFNRPCPLFHRSSYMRSPTVSFVVSLVCLNICVFVCARVSFPPSLVPFFRPSMFLSFKHPIVLRSYGRRSTRRREPSLEMKT
jgi:hypothetical protein